MTKVLFDCPLPPWMVGVAAAVLLGVVVAFARQDARHLRALARRAILALVVLATAMLTGLVLNPKVIRTWPDPHKPLCAVLVDGSRSMSIADCPLPIADSEEGRGARDEGRGKTPGGAAPAPAASPAIENRKSKIENPDGVKITREEAVRRLLAAGPRAWLAKLGAEFELAGWRFSAEGRMEALPLSLEERGTDPSDKGPVPFAVDPEGYATALGEALDGATQRAGDARPRVLVLVSDGAWNAGRDPSEVARVLGRLGIPVFAVGVGQPNPPRDAAVASLRGPESVHLGDEMLLTAEVAATGLGAARLPVRLTSGTSPPLPPLHNWRGGEGGEVLGEKQVVTLPDGRPVKVSFSFVPDAPGQRVFTVAVLKQEGEENESNNTASVSLEVIERKIRTLLVEGRPRWEFRFLRNVCERDPAVQLTTCLLRDDIKAGGAPTAGPGYLKSLPVEEKALLEYDVIVLGDVPRAGLPDKFLELLAARVRDHGGALIVIAGRRGNYRGLAGTPVAGILPVALEGPGEGDTRGGSPFGVEVTQEGLSHLVTRLAADPEENEATWSRLPRIQWSAAVGGLARGATALLVHPYRLSGATKLPLLAVQQVGSGKVLWLGTEETWRWRREVGDPYHYRFWAQALRWLVKKQFAQGDPRARLSLDRAQCDLGETVEIEAYCLDRGGFPLEDARVWVRIEPAEKVPGASSPVRLAMEPKPGGWGLYRAVFKPTAPGTYIARPIVSVHGEEPLASSVSFTVVRPDLEQRFLAQDVATLNAIASASGGEYLRVEESGRLPSLLAAKIERRMLTAELSPCRHGGYYMVLALLLSAAWLIRKRSGLA
jgi:hypothetical protein